MSFRALLVTKDGQAADVLAPVLSGFGLMVQCCGYSDAICVVSEQKFQIVLVDFEDPASAALIFQSLLRAPFENHAVTVALLGDKRRVRQAFGAGANFVVYKPVEADACEATLRAATTLIKRERRTHYRVPIQVAVRLQLQTDDGPAELDGILLDLSESGMDVLAAQPLSPSGSLHARFTLPNSPSEFEIAGDVAWANPNGETGVRFTETPDSLRGALRCWLEENSREAPSEEPDPVPGCNLTDLSLGACYIETPSPLPERTHVLLVLRAEGVEFQAQGLVRVMHPSHGMGIEFASRTAEQRRQTEQCIQFLMSHPGIQPELLVYAQELVATPESLCAPADDVEDPLLDLLRNHESLTEDAFLQMLRRQRNAEFVETE